MKEPMNRFLPLTLLAASVAAPPVFAEPVSVRVSPDGQTLERDTLGFNINIASVAADGRLDEAPWANPQV